MNDDLDTKDSRIGQRRRVVIVGGGFGGLAAARALRRADVDVTVIDRMNHHLFQPLLYQVATGAISASDCATPIRVHLKRQSNASVLMAEVADFDVGRRQVILERGERLDYDSLIVACGAQTSYFGHDEWADVSFGLKTLADAVDLRSRVFAAFEEAERTDDPETRDEWLTFVVVGGGPTGVEVAGQVAVIARHQLKREFSRIDAAEARVILIDAGERVLPAFKPSLSAKAAKGLTSLGATLRERETVEAIDERGVMVKVGDAMERIPARTVIWAAGVRAAGVAAALAAATGAPTDRAGRIEIRPDLTLGGHPEVSVIGDVARLAGPDGKPLPGLATVAIQQARHAAKAIRRGGAGASTPFRYRDKGALAVVGRGRAVCEIRGRGLSGFPAFLMYLGVHLYYLGGVLGRRLQVLGAWARAGFGTLRGRVVERELTSAEPASRTGGTMPS
jgi:NADH dehydrogenase